MQAQAVATMLELANDAVDPPCKWLTSHFVELANHSKSEHLFLAADWAVARTTPWNHGLLK